jgi:hypothetical protein
MVNDQYYTLNFRSSNTPNNLIINTKIKIKIRFHFPFITHHIVQCKIKLFDKNIINFHLFLLYFAVEPTMIFDSLYEPTMIFDSLYEINFVLIIINSSSYVLIYLYLLRMRLLGFSMFK